MHSIFLIMKIKIYIHIVSPIYNLCTMLNKQHQAQNCQVTGTYYLEAKVFFITALHKKVIGQDFYF